MTIAIESPKPCRRERIEASFEHFFPAGYGSIYPALASLAAETERLIRLVNDLLMLTRADAGTLRLQPQPLDLTGLARRRVEHLTVLAAPRQVRLRVVELEESSAALAWADADRLAQVLDNLLDNAIRHSPPGSEVTVTVAPEADQLRCEVADSGPGIPAEHLPFIFERFYRADPARSRSLATAAWAWLLPAP
ncbi:MAG: cell wall metabolism sensor histidine kinase WalK [Anaerolineales bacterium]|nr:cell wall metabolism sensor histidine kinase WalK [Anaerolineales bacterium]